MTTDTVNLCGQTASVCATLATLGSTVTPVRDVEIVNYLVLRDFLTSSSTLLVTLASILITTDV